MSKYPDLVNRLRGVTEKPTLKLRSTVGINPRYEGISIWSEKILNNPDGPAAAAALEAQAKRIAELEAALKPFVPDTDMSEEEYTSVWNHHLIQARKVLEGK